MTLVIEYKIIIATFQNRQKPGCHLFGMTVALFFFFCQQTQLRQRG